MKNPISDELFIIFAAVFGAMTSALLSDKLSWQQKATVLLSGAGFAIFVGPAICEYCGVTSPYVIGAVLYFGGVLGNLLIIRVLAWAKSADLVHIIFDHYRGKKGE